MKKQAIQLLTEKVNDRVMTEYEAVRLFELYEEECETYSREHAINVLKQRTNNQQAIENIGNRIVDST